MTVVRFVQRSTSFRDCFYLSVGMSVGVCVFSSARVLMCGEMLVGTFRGDLNLVP